MQRDPRPTSNSKPCSDNLRPGISRRRFVQTAAAGASLVGMGLPLGNGGLHAAPDRDSPAETAVREFFSTLDAAQKQQMALPLDDARRKRISANWSITKATIGDFSAAQQELLDRILRGITSEDGYDRFTRQMKDDWGSVQRYAVAIFGNPLEGPFEFELTGRHLTLRADANTIDGCAFGGPIVYGHSAKGNSPKNLFYYQTERANQVFEMLDESQRKTALLSEAPAESAVQLRDGQDGFPGLAGKNMSADQQQLLMDVLKDILKPYRQADVDEVMQFVESGGGADTMHVAFYQSGDLDNDKIWDIWRLESPRLVCHFRGAPHVHAYINVGKKS